MALLWLLPAALLAAALFGPLKARLRGSVAWPEGGMLLLEVTALFGLLHYRFRFSLHLLRRPSLSILWHKETGEVRVIWDLSHTLLPKNRSGKRSGVLLKVALSHMRLKRFDLGGAVGIEGDACLTALLAGALGQALYFYFFGLFEAHQREAVRVALQPDFSGDALRLNLEGIASVLPVQIIDVALLHLAARAKTKRKEASFDVASH